MSYGNEEIQALDQQWNSWKEENPWYLSTADNDARLTAEMTSMVNAGHALDRDLLDKAARNLANRAEISIVPMSLTRKGETSTPTPAAPKKFAQDDLASGTLTHDGHISVLKIRQWEQERAEELQAEKLQRQLQESRERDARNQPEPEEISGELPLSLMDSPTEEARVLSLPSVTPAKIRRYMSRKNEETLRRMQEKARRG